MVCRGVGAPLRAAWNLTDRAAQTTRRRATARCKP
jgi:hypothetical protein